MSRTEATVIQTAYCARQIYDQHCHTSYEILFVLSGSIRLNLEGEQLLLTENTGIVVEPLKYHIVTGNNGPYHRLILTFGQEAVPEVIYSAFLERIRQNPRIGGNEVSRLLERYASAVTQKDPVLEPLLSALLIQAIYAITLADPEYPPEASGKSRERLRQITAFVEANLHRQISLKDVAEHMYISESSLCHLFRQEMNISLKQYILRKKMMYAKSLLEQGTLPGTAAALCGYQNYASFYKVFLKITGQTPGGDRKAPRIYEGAAERSES